MFRVRRCKCQDSVDRKHKYDPKNKRREHDRNCTHPVLLQFFLILMNSKWKQEEDCKETCIQIQLPVTAHKKVIYIVDREKQCEKSAHDREREDVVI